MYEKKLKLNDTRNSILKDIYKTLLKNKIQYVCISNSYYQEEGSSGDIDLLVALEDINKTYCIIRELLIDKKIYYLERKYISTNKFDKLKFLIDTDSKDIEPCLQIDIIHSIYNKGLTFIEYEDISKFAFCKNGVKILDPKINSYLGFFKDMVYCQKIKNTRNIENSNINNFIIFLQEFGYSFFLLETLILNYEKKFLRIFLLIIIYLDNFSSRKLLEFVYFYVNLIKIILSGYYRKKLIVFYGPDGAGKTTLINSTFGREIFTKYFDEIIIKHTKPGLIPPLSKFKFRRIKNITTIKKRSTIPLKKLTATIHFFYYGFDYFLEKVYLSCSFISRKKILIVYDRHIYEMAYQQTYSKLSKKLLLLLSKISFRPIINFFIYGNSKIIYLRKKELSVDEINFQINAFVNVDKKYFLMSKKINNSKDISRSLKKTFEIVINNLKQIP